MKEKELPGMTSNFNSLLNQQHQARSLQMLQPSNFDPQNDFLEQMFSSVPPSASASASVFPWADDQPPLGNLEEQSPAVLASKIRQQQISNGAAKALMLQQQLLLSRGLAGGNGQMLHRDHEDGVDAQSFFSPINLNLANDASVKAVFNDFSGSIGQTSNQPANFLHHESGALHQSQNFVTPAVTQPAASGSSGGGSAAGQPKQRMRARRGQATDPHSIAERLRRERIAERMKALQELVPNANKDIVVKARLEEESQSADTTDKASMLDEIIDYVKFLQLQVKVLSMSRLGGAAAVAPLVADKSSEGRGSNGTQTASASNNKEGMTAAEHQVAKLMEEDMGSAMQYLQGKGLCLMPISLATTISTTTITSGRNHHLPPPPPNNPLLNSDAAGPASPSISVLTVQSAINGSGGEISVTAASKLSDRSCFLNGVD